MMKRWKVEYQDPDDKRHTYIRIGTEVYRTRHFIVLEFQGKIGRFREAFYRSDLTEV